MSSRFFSPVLEPMRLRLSTAIEVKLLCCRVGGGSYFLSNGRWSVGKNFHPERKGSLFGVLDGPDAHHLP